MQNIYCLKGIEKGVKLNRIMLPPSKKKVGKNIRASFREQTKFFVNDGLLEKLTNELDRSEK